MIMKGKLGLGGSGMAVQCLNVGQSNAPSQLLELGRFMVKRSPSRREREQRRRKEGTVSLLPSVPRRQMRLLNKKSCRKRGREGRREKGPREKKSPSLPPSLLRPSYSHAAPIFLDFCDVSDGRRGGRSESVSGAPKASSKEPASSHERTYRVDPFGLQTRTLTLIQYTQSQSMFQKK